MKEKKEIKVDKSLVKLFLKSIFLSILTLFIIQHFGKISGGRQVTDGSQDNYGLGKYLYTQPFKFENPINGEKYYEDYNPAYGIEKDRKETYLMKLKDFYLPSLFGNLTHILICTVIYVISFLFLRNYRVKFK